MKINSMAIKSGDNIWYSKAFMDTLESHLDYLRKSSKSNVTQIDPRKASIYEGDFFGYLNDANIEQQYHWLIMRINDMYCSTDFNGDKLIIVLPDKNEIEQIRISHTATGAMTI